MKEGSAGQIMVLREMGGCVRRVGGRESRVQVRSLRSPSMQLCGGASRGRLYRPGFYCSLFLNHKAANHLTFTFFYSNLLAPIRGTQVGHCREMFAKKGDSSFTSRSLPTQSEKIHRFIALSLTAAHSVFKVALGLCLALHCPKKPFDRGSF